MMRLETQAWCGVTLRGMSRQQKRKEVLLILYYVHKNWYYFIKEYQNCQNLLFKKLITKSGNQTDIFRKFYSSTGTLCLPKTFEQVLGYTIVWLPCFNFSLRLSPFFWQHIITTKDNLIFSKQQLKNLPSFEFSQSKYDNLGRRGGGGFVVTMFQIFYLDWLWGSQHSQISSWVRHAYNMCSKTWLSIFFTNYFSKINSIPLKYSIPSVLLLLLQVYQHEVHPGGWPR